MAGVHGLAHSPLIHYMMLYIIAPSPSGPCKIGYARDMRKRLISLQIGNHLRLYLHSTWTHPQRQVQVCERLLHHQFKPKHIRGEWFNITVSEAEIAAAAIGMDRPALTPALGIDAIQSMLASSRMAQAIAIS